MARRTPRTIGAIVRTERDRRGLSQTALAAEASKHYPLASPIDGQAISKIERDESFPSFARIVALSRALGVDLDAMVPDVWPERL